LKEKIFGYEAIETVSRSEARETQFDSPPHLLISYWWT